jgi:hypothetical protein
MSAYRAGAASSAALADAGISQEDAALAASAVDTPTQPPETAPPEIFCTLVWMQEDLDGPLESGEGKLGQRVRGRGLSELFFVGEIEP